MPNGEIEVAIEESPEWDKIPQAELDVLNSRLSRESRNIRFVRWLDGGYSGSPVAHVRDTVSGHSSTERILKFCGTGYSEVQGIEAAYERAPREFKKLHLVEPKRSFPLHDWHCILMEIAGSDLSLPALQTYEIDERLPDICAILIKSLLNDWNAGDRDFGDVTNTGKFLRQVVGPHKLEAGGSLSDFASRSGLDWNAQWISRPGWDERLRNPLAMLSEDYGSQMVAVVGNGHGDLSVFNVLIPGIPDLEIAGYWLIDYGSSGPKLALTRDPIYLLLSLATRWLKETKIPSMTSRSIIKLLAFDRERVKPANIVLYEKVFTEVIRTGYEWANLKKLGYHWIPQSRLSIIGCALAFIERRIDTLDVAETNDWLFDLAAVAATEYWKAYENKSVPPSPDPWLRDLTPMPAATGAPTEGRPVNELVEALDGATFGREHWTQLELGTRDLRVALSETYAVDSASRVAIAGLIGELQRVLKGAVSPLAQPGQLSVASRRAEELRERLITLLRS